MENEQNCQILRKKRKIQNGIPFSPDHGASSSPFPEGGHLPQHPSSVSEGQILVNHEAEEPRGKSSSKKLEAKHRLMKVKRHQSGGGEERPASDGEHNSKKIKVFLTHQTDELKRAYAISEFFPWG